MFEKNGQCFKKGLTISNRIILDVTQFYHVGSSTGLRKIFLFVIKLKRDHHKP
jgi:hypothetical protein